MSPEPQHLDQLLERAVLAACLLAPWAFSKVVEILTPEDFSDRASREIFRALLSMHERGVPPDATLLVIELTRSKKISVRGPNSESVFGLLQMAAVGAHLQFYVDELVQTSKARQKALELVESSNRVGGCL
jgi:replicative DNA helicase